MGGHGRTHWGPSCSQSRAQEGRGRHRLSTVIQPLRQSASEVVDLTVDEDGKDTGSYKIEEKTWRFSGVNIIWFYNNVFA